MSLMANELIGPPGLRQRTSSNTSQHSQQSGKQTFPLMTSDSGLYTCSSNTSDCSLQLESDTDSSNNSSKAKVFKDERLQLALQDVRKLRSELERLSQSEQWYKQELRQQKTIRLDDLERIYSQERKFMKETQRLQKECVRLYEKCNELERELEKQNQDFHEHSVFNIYDDDSLEENLLEFEKEQQLSLIKDQQQLISVLRKQKRALLGDLRSLTEEKDEKVNELQRLLADVEFENKVITKKCSQFAKERLHIENTLKQNDNRISLFLEEKMNLQKSIVDLNEQLEIQQQLVKLKESEIESMQQHYTHKIQHEQDLDQVHELSMKYQEEINAKTLEIINLKERLQEMQNELDDMTGLQQQNEQQQRQIDQLHFTLETYNLELQELKTSEVHKNNQIEELHSVMEQLIKDKEIAYKTTVQQQNDLVLLKQTLKSTQQQYEQVQELFKNTQFQLEMLEVEHGKAKFQNDRDRQEIEHLRNKLKEYLQQTTELSNKIQFLETELGRIIKENLKLQEDSEQMRKLIKDNEEKGQRSLLEAVHSNDEEDLTKNKLTTKILYQGEDLFKQDTDNISDDKDFLELQQQCEKLQEKLDFIKDTQYEKCQENCLLVQNKKCSEVHQLEESLSYLMKEVSQVESKRSEEYDIDLKNLLLQGSKFQENLDKLNSFLKEKQHLLHSLNRTQASNEGIEKLVKENEILKKKLNAIGAEALALQIKDNINESTLKHTQMEENLENHARKVESLKKNLLENDGKLYKMERKFREMNENSPKLEELQLENTRLKENLMQECASKAVVSRKLVEETNKLKELRQTLEELKKPRTSSQNQAVQCNLSEKSEENEEIKELKERVLQLQQDQQHFLEYDGLKKQERLQLLQQMMNLQNNKMQNLQQNQKDWEEILTALNSAHALEEKTRKELELKRMELEELNQVFEEQNEEFRKLEEFTTLLEIKRQHEKEQLELTFQQEINVMKQHLQDCQKQIEQQKIANEQLEKQNDRFQQDIDQDFASELATYKNEIRELKSRVSRIIEEKESLLEHVRELEEQNKDHNDKKREAILMPDFNMVKVMEASTQSSVENVEVLKQNISEDHLRILTKVLEAEYQRKMLRYDEHIHSLLSNLKGLKRSLRANEEKTAQLSDEQIKTQEELKELQSTKRSLEEMRLKYEQSQNTIKELRDTLTFERKKFELSDLGKSSQSNGATYEVSNLIDDYKKLIQQSALATKRPSTSGILDLIQRSNKYVPNLQKLETNVEGLRSDLQNFLYSYSQRIPATSLIATASLSVPPSLMDELRAASEGF